MARKKKESTPGENLAKQIIEQYNPKSVEDMQNALKDIFGPMFEAMLQGEMNDHLGYESNDHGSKSTDNRRNGYTRKKIKTSTGEVDIKVPRDRDASFDPKLVPKRKKDVSEIEAKVLSMYARGMSQRDIAETIEDIYGFEISHETISEITDCVLEELNDWGYFDTDESCCTQTAGIFVAGDCRSKRIRQVVTASADGAIAAMAACRYLEQ
jgi:transposase-like protein